MLKDKKSIAPQNIDKHNWYYEEKEGIVLIHEVRDNIGEYIRTDTIVIPNKLLRRCVADSTPAKLEEGNKRLILERDFLIDTANWILKKCEHALAPKES